VELIVVIVIIGILAAIAVPALTGYIEKANNQKTLSEARTVLTALQAAVSERYGTANQITTGFGATNSADLVAIVNGFAGTDYVAGSGTDEKPFMGVTGISETGTITGFYMYKDNKNVQYNNGDWSISALRKK
jgi:type II secretory pathway pseudopilin PulG